ncbi:MAG: sulfite exporter TauE/SafE family protein [Acidimicrobiia bacterium]|nr:sulfite exporter TauE/SafE family protein [Acidimicrobiia bacterium]
MGIVARILTGFLIAAATTPAGVSGAFLLLPVQVQVFNVPSPAVSATNLVYNVVSSPAGVLSYDRHGRMDWPLALSLISGTAPAVVVGVSVRTTWLADPQRFGIVAALLLFALGIRLVAEVLSQSRALPTRAELPPMWRRVAVGAVAGFVGGIYGLGGAALIVPYLVSVERMPISRVAGAGLATTMATSVIGLVTFALAEVAGIGHADAPRWIDGIALGVGGLGGAIVGARLQPRVPVPALKIILGIAALAAGLRLLP